MVHNNKQKETKKAKQVSISLQPGSSHQMIDLYRNGSNPQQNQQHNKKKEEKQQQQQNNNNNNNNNNSVT